MKRGDRRSSRRHRHFGAALLILITACLPPLHDPEGYACDGTHACPDPLACIANRCVRPSDGGVRWSQVRDGFDGTLKAATGACNGCDVSIDTTNGNLVTASMSTDGTRYVAYAQDAGVIVGVPRGRVRGELRVPGAFPMPNSGFFTVESLDSNFTLNLFLNGPLVGVYSAPGALSDFQESQMGSVAIDGGAWHVVEARWVRGVSREVWVDGKPAASKTVSAPTDAGLGLLPGSLRVGINNYNNTGPLWTVELRNWVYSEDPDAVFP